MNDLEEVRFGMNAGGQLFFTSPEIESACRSKKRFEMLKAAFTYWYNAFTNEHLLDLYVFCLSVHSQADTDGLLSMWRGYGGNGRGAAIVFDTSNDTDQIAEQWDRMGQLYASLKTGHVTASVALKRLVGFSAKNRFYRANRDLGRIFKTEFILQYLSEPELRSRIRRGLLKVEQLHALARDVFYGRRGRINARELWEQMNTCSCLNLILACIVYWQAREISRVLSQCDPVANGVDTSLLEHVSPIEWNNVVLYGQYILDRKLVRRRRRRSTKVTLSV
jgi:hypothetical protein